MLTYVRSSDVIREKAVQKCLFRTRITINTPIRVSELAMLASDTWRASEVRRSDYYGTAPRVMHVAAVWYQGYPGSCGIIAVAKKDYVLLDGVIGSHYQGLDESCLSRLPADVAFDMLLEMKRDDRANVIDATVDFARVWDARTFVDLSDDELLIIMADGE